MNRQARVVMRAVAVCGALVAGDCVAQEMKTVADLGADAKPLSKTELEELMPGATISRRSSGGSDQQWTQDRDGTFFLRSDNKLISSGGGSTTRGKWSVSDEGRYCVTIPWKGRETEDWCRVVFHTQTGYFMA
ncbi:MAG: hypothetical protein JWP52_4452 [Rhizobacter sp.]|nr:hypothetical protein [Rhizobacter sp.]